MPYNTPAKQRAYNKKNKVRNRIRRRKYFREYGRRNKARLTMISMMGGLAKMMAKNKLISDELVDKAEQMRRENLKLEIKINRIKNFVNIK